MMSALDDAEGAGRKPPGLASAIAATLAAAAAAFCYWVAQSSIAGMGGGPAAGGGITAAIAIFGEMLLWLCLGLYLVAQCWRSRLPGLLLAAFAVAWLAAAWAATLAIEVMDAAGEGPTWLRLFPTILPWVALLFGLWVRAGRHLQPRTRRIGMVAFALLAAPLIVIPIVEKQRWDALAPARAAARAAAHEASMAEQRERFRAADAEREAARPGPAAR